LLGHWQQTLKHRIGCTGVGLHSGRKVRLELTPAEAGSGIWFRRTDLPGAPAVAARWDMVGDTQLCTTLTDGKGVSVITIEHLMAALAGMGVDNAVIELDGPEVPAMDGSAAPFVFLIECAGLEEQLAPRRYVEVLRPVRVSDGEARATLTPSDGFSIGFDIDFRAAAIGRQRAFFDGGSDSFKAALAGARTFGMIEEVDGLKARGFALGGSLDNAVVVSGERVLNAGGLRYADEFVRHKMLDSLGDLALAAAPILGHFHGSRSGHALNNRLLQALFADARAWRLVDGTAIAERGAALVANA
jgi:UDP-3-O-[3-hydroxymyristoyl] N-acetylglucosamine deacetylase